MAERPRVVAVEGPSAAGKSTVVARLAATEGWVPIAEASDRLGAAADLRFGSARELERLERRLLDEEALRWSTARAWVRRGRWVVADTGFLGPLAYTRGLVDEGLAPVAALRPLVREATRLAHRGAWGLPDVTAYLVLPAERRRDRAAADPERHPSDLFARHERIGRREARFYRRAWPAVAPGRVRSVEGAGSVERVARNVARAARRPLPAGDPDRALPRLLAVLGAPAPSPPGRRRAAAATVKKRTGRPLDPRR